MAFSTMRFEPYVGVVTAAVTGMQTPVPEALDVLVDNLQVPTHQSLHHTVINRVCMEWDLWQTFSDGVLRY
jgi:hypothetical protein